jgi:hypothetical protein
MSSAPPLRIGAFRRGIRPQGSVTPPQRSSDGHNSPAASGRVPEGAEQGIARLHRTNKTRTREGTERETVILRLLWVHSAHVQVYRVRNCCLSIIGHSPVRPPASFRTCPEDKRGRRTPRGLCARIGMNAKNLACNCYGMRRRREMKRYRWRIDAT